MAKPPANLAASVRRRLLNLARTEGRDFQMVLVGFGPQAWLVDFLVRINYLPINDLPINRLDELLA